MLGHLFQNLRRRMAGPEASGGGARRSPAETLILFFNPAWGEPLETDPESRAAGCRFTTDRRRFDEAAAVVFHIPTLSGLPAWKPPGKLWVASSMECEVNYPRLRDPAYMSRFDLTMTYRLSADVVTAYTSYYGDGANLARALRTPPRPKAEPQDLGPVTALRADPAVGEELLTPKPLTPGGCSRQSLEQRLGRGRSNAVGRIDQQGPQRRVDVRPAEPSKRAGRRPAQVAILAPQRPAQQRNRARLAGASKAPEQKEQHELVRLFEQWRRLRLVRGGQAGRN